MAYLDPTTGQIMDGTGPNDTTAPGPNGGMLPSAPGALPNYGTPPTGIGQWGLGTITDPTTGQTRPGTPVAPGTTTVPQAGGAQTVNWGNYTGDPNDPTQLAAYVKYLSTQPDADPTLASDPNYWINVIQGKGGLTQANIGYFQTRATNAGNAAHAAGDTSGQTPGSMPPPTPFTAPTMQDLLNSPGYQARLKTGEDVIQNSAAAKGDLLTGGTLKDLSQFGQDYATSNYNNLFSQSLAANQSNFGQQLSSNQNQFSQLYDLSNLGLIATNSQNALAGIYGTNIAGLLTGIGNAQAGGTIGSGNALSGGVGNLGNLASYYSLFGGG
jgi:hypothetical protein